MIEGTQAHRAVVLTAFHEECPRPTADDIRAWIARYPELADDLRLHAEASLAEAQDATSLPQPTATLIARTRARAITALNAARTRAGSPRAEPEAIAQRTGIDFVDIRQRPKIGVAAIDRSPVNDHFGQADDRTIVQLASMSAACGFPSPADDHMEDPVDFNQLLVRNPAATFAVRVSGESMRERGLLSGDVAVVDRGRKPVNGCIILGLVDGEFTVKTFRVKGGTVTLEAANPDFLDIAIDEGTSFEVWGVVVGIARTL